MIRRMLGLTALTLVAGCGGNDDGEPTAPTSIDADIVEGGLPEAAADPKRTDWAIATAHPLATAAGVNVLKQGGAAVDAAIAVQAVLGLVEPQSSGLGGGAFMMYYDASSGRVTAYDGREVAPYSATPDMFMKDSGLPMGFYDAVTSGRSVGVPGVVAMLALAHTEHGQMEWAPLFTDAEQLAMEGFPVTERLSGLLERTSRLIDTPAARELYYDENGQPVAPGTILKNPAYASTVRMLANEGPSVFYTGPVAQQIITAVNDKVGPGTMTPEDLAEYNPVERQPVCGMFLEYRVCSMGPPSSGGVTVLQILGLYERAVTPDMPRTEAWAKYLEASRLAYADRALYLSDPISMGEGDVSANQVVNGLIAPAYLDSRADLVGPSAAEEVEAGDPLAFPLKEGRAPDASPDAAGTSHFSIRDSHGNIVSMTTTVEFAFGSHLMAGGFILNNQLTDFSFLPEKDGVPVANAPGPGKRPRSSMSPVIVFGPDGEPVMAIGSPGGPAIIGYVAKTLIATLAWDMPLQEAIELPNIVVPRGSVLVEDGMGQDVIGAIEAYNLAVQQRALTSGLYGFRIEENGDIEGGADPRRDGSFVIAD